jgi:hypothetical protein
MTLLGSMTSMCILLVGSSQLKSMDKRSPMDMRHGREPAAFRFGSIALGAVEVVNAVPGDSINGVTITVAITEAITEEWRARRTINHTF